MKTSRMVLLICTLAMSLALQSAAWGYTTAADTMFRWVNPSFHTEDHGTSTVAGLIVPGANGAGSTYLLGFDNGNFGISSSAAAVQDYGIFYGQAFTRAYDNAPFPPQAFQTFATGTFSESLTIPSAPSGVPFGSTGTLMPGWNVTGSISSGAAGSAYLGIFASTNASLPNTYSNTVAIHGNGHYDLVGPISFTFDTPFLFTVSSEVFAAVGYSTTTVFSDAASADFLHTVILSSVGVNDSAGNSLADFTIITDSGRPFLPSPVPVPSTLLLLGPALAGLAVMRRRFKA
jgi:hypothetical protein